MGSATSCTALTLVDGKPGLETLRSVACIPFPRDEPLPDDFDEVLSLPLIDDDFRERGGRLEYLLLTGALRLVKATWLLRLAGRRRSYGVTYWDLQPLRRSQDLPREAFWEPAEAAARWRAAGPGFFVAVSCGWVGSRAPDAPGDAFQLKRVSRLVDICMQAMGEGDATSRAWGDMGDLGIFWDYLSLPQRHHWDDDRTPSELRRFDAARGNMQLVYGHWHTAVLRQGGLPDTVRRPLRSRGWMLFELAVASMKGLSMGLRRGSVLPHSAQRTLFLIDEAVAFDFRLGRHTHPDLPEGLVVEHPFDPEVECDHPLQLLHRAAERGRVPPLHPAAFAARVAAAEFAEAADAALVCELHRSAWGHLAGAAQLGFAGLGWRRGEAEALGASLPHLPRLWLLAAGRNPLGDAGVAAVAAGVRGAVWLESLDLAETDCGDEGARAVAAALPSLARLRSLALTRNRLSEAGKMALRAAWRREGKRQEALSLDPTPPEMEGVDVVS